MRLSVILAPVILSLLLFPPASLATDAIPKLYCPKANPNTVHFGAQPMGNPLVLSVSAGGPGGDISAVIVNLEELEGAKYYDPISDTVNDVGVDTPMLRVYEIGGAEAYLVNVGSRYEYNEYRRALTHELVRGTAAFTNKWQVELPFAGNLPGDYSLRVIAKNTIYLEGTAAISLDVVDDSTAPEVSVGVKYIINSPVTRVGDQVVIEAEATDGQSGVFSVRLIDDGAEAVFGENPNLVLTRQPGSNLWEVQNTVAQNIAAGMYTIEVAAIDRAGNEAIQTLGVEVAEEISSLQFDLSEGWNLISVPRALANPAVSDVFAGLPVDSVRTIVGGHWIDVTEINPGLGYLLRATADITLPVELEDYNPSAIPLTVELGQGWNLIGYASWALKPMMPLTFYLGDVLKDEWLLVYTGDGEQARPQSTSPYIWATDGFPTVTGEPYSEDTSENLPRVELGMGYWIYLTDEGVLVP